MQQDSQTVSEAEVKALVRRFYDRVRADPLLGPVFEPVILDWDEHLGAIEDFWSLVLCGSDRYRGCVMGVHRGMRLEPAHFDRWLDLFGAAAGETLPPAGRERAMDVARAVDQRLRLIAGVAAA